jgi:hypothetical protein
MYLAHAAACQCPKLIRLNAFRASFEETTPFGKKVQEVFRCLDDFDLLKSLETTECWGFGNLRYVIKAI